MIIWVSTDSPKKEEIMKQFKIVIAETQYYEVYVEADTPSEAEDIACDTYGEDGNIFSTDVAVVNIEEEE